MFENVEDFLVDGKYVIPKKYITKGILNNIQGVMDKKSQDDWRNVQKVCDDTDKLYSKIEKDFKNNNKTVPLDDIYEELLDYSKYVMDKFYKEFTKNVRDKGVITLKQAILLQRLYHKSKISMMPAEDQGREHYTNYEYW